ncbi:MAG: glycosyltransferase, partial [Candidatus Kryptoniota bacterium]
ESEVLYPPIQDFLIEGIPRRKIILSVGRFFKGLYNDKRYDILTAAFRNLSKDMPAWEYHLVGSTSPDKQTQKLIIDLKTANENFPVFFHTDEPYESLKRLYNEALILWHGAGYGVDEIRHPEMTEHFGMSVAEAMSAQCVPIVVNKGGIREIVIHGENGFLWSTTDELIRYTLQVANLSLAELQRLQENAREEYRNFAVTSFNKQVAELFSQLLVEPHLDT